uniref:Neur_chan_LBD domain-containing protein n=1 Tax=Heterorhabditis bacteriophora TaxID=37862 RepID=A0A1I7X9P1_HETBA
MLGEPLGWESALQLLIDVLLTSGAMMDFKRGASEYPAQIPVIACNVDLVWMAEKSELPRIGHGIFIHCVETLYEKLTGRRMHYEAVLGKPTEISYLHAAHVVQRHAHQMGLNAIKTLYVIGDNPMSDVLGSKLFDRYLRHGGRGRFDHLDLDLLEESDPPEVRTRHVVDRCISVLVETGVYKEGCRMNGTVQPVSMLMESLSAGEQASLQQPDFVENDLFAALRQILTDGHVMLLLAIFIFSYRSSFCHFRESQLYSKLLEDYQPLERPVANSSQPVNVHMGVVLQQIISVVC